MKNHYALMACIALFASSPSTAAAPRPPAHSIDDIARAYVDTGLSLARFDSNPYLFIGPGSRQESARQDQRSLSQLEQELGLLLSELAALPVPEDHATRLRYAGLRSRLIAMQTRVRILQGHMPASFDDETRLMFGVVVPRKSEEHFRQLIAELDGLIPGEGPLPARMEAFRDQFVIPKEKLNTVMSFALEECRKRTVQHIALPDYEGVSLQIVGNKPWVGFTQFQGNGRSIIYINQDVPIHIERALELGCHEAYPGHHTNVTLIEKEIARGRGWPEYTYFALYGPTAVVAEGMANFGVDLAYGKDERLAFEKSVLLEMAGLSDKDFDRYTRYLALQQELNYARNEAARRYLYEGMSREQAIQWLMDFGLETRGTATQRLDFIDSFRAYVVCYNYGLDVVKNYVANIRPGNETSPWGVFSRILAGAITPEEILQAQTH